jgi:hypothetical protein
MHNDEIVTIATEEKDFTNLNLCRVFVNNYKGTNEITNRAIKRFLAYKMPKSAASC